jgi:hypothetical protein
MSWLVDFFALANCDENNPANFMCTSWSRFDRSFQPVISEQPVPLLAHMNSPALRSLLVSRWPNEWRTATSGIRTNAFYWSIAILRSLA